MDWFLYDRNLDHERVDYINLKNIVAYREICGLRKSIAPDIYVMRAAWKRKWLHKIIIVFIVIVFILLVSYDFALFGYYKTYKYKHARRIFHLIWAEGRGKGNTRKTRVWWILKTLSEHVVAILTSSLAAKPTKNRKLLSPYQVRNKDILDICFSASIFQDFCSDLFCCYL